MVLHAARDVQGVRADQADAHGLPPAGPGRRRVEVGQPQPLQHVPVLRGARRSRPRTCRPATWVAAVTLARSRSPRGSATGGWTRTAHPVGVNHSPTSSSGGAGGSGQQRRAGRHPGGLAEELHLDPARGQVPVGRAGRPPRRRAAARPARPTAAGRRRSAGPPPCRGPRGTPGTAGTATPACSRSATVVKRPPWSTSHAPAASQLPMCGSAQITPRRSAIALSSTSAPRKSVPARIRSGPITGSRNASSQYRAYERRPRRTQRGQLGVGGGRSATRRRLARSRAAPRPPRRAARSAPARNAADATGSGSARPAPSRRRSPRPRPARAASPVLSPLTAAAPRRAGPRWAAPRGCRRPRPSAGPTVIADSSTSAHRATASAYGTPRPSRPPCRPADAAAPAAPPARRRSACRRPRRGPCTYETSCPGPGRAGRPAAAPAVPGAGEPPQQRAEDGRVGDPVQRRVQHRAEPAGPAADPGHRAVDHVGMTKHR